MENKILQELKELRKTRIACYSERVKIKDISKDEFEIILNEDTTTQTINLDNIIINCDKIVVKDRELNFITYLEYGEFESPIIDLSKGYIEIYDSFEGDFLFVYKEFKDDQLDDKIDLENYPIISHSITDSKLIQGYYEIVIKIRMGPLDEYDYNIRLFSSKNQPFEYATSILSEYRNKILNGEFINFFTFEIISFIDDYEGISKNISYKILDHHYDEDYFTIQKLDIINEEDEEIYKIPFIATLGAIEPVMRD